jgi:hypothetical protein
MTDQEVGQTSFFNSPIVQEATKVSESQQYPIESTSGHIVPQRYTEHPVSIECPCPFEFFC